MEFWKRFEDVDRTLVRVLSLTGLCECCASDRDVCVYNTGNKAQPIVEQCDYCSGLALNEAYNRDHAGR